MASLSSQSSTLFLSSFLSFWFNSVLQRLKITAATNVKLKTEATKIEKTKEKNIRSPKNLENTGVVVNISQNIDTKERLDEKVERIKKLVREGKYPLDRDKLAEKILQFLTDVG